MNNNIQKLSIIIPAFNEGPTIYKILDKINDVELINGIQKEIIVINDFSTDNTAPNIKAYMTNNGHQNILYFEHDKNKGKGAALHTGIQNATGDVIVIQDADLEYDPNEYNILCESRVKKLNL